MIAIIDYKAGNAPSVLHAVSHLGYHAGLVSDADSLKKANHIILPGVGSAGATMQSLKELGIMETLEDCILREKKLFLGICVGMQVLFEKSAEDNADCLGWLKGAVVKYDSSQVRVPQMGWNKVRFAKEAGFDVRDDYFYFVNSFYAVPENISDVWGIVDYGMDCTAAVNRENIYGMQFHVEKSAKAGLAALNSFLQFKGGR